MPRDKPLDDKSLVKLTTRDKNRLMMSPTLAWSDLIFDETQEGKEFVLKFNDFGTILGVHFLFPLPANLAKHFFCFA